MGAQAVPKLHVFAADQFILVLGQLDLEALAHARHFPSRRVFFLTSNSKSVLEQLHDRCITVLPLGCALALVFCLKQKKYIVAGHTKAHFTRFLLESKLILVLGQLDLEVLTRLTDFASAGCFLTSNSESVSE